MTTDVTDEGGDAPAGDGTLRSAIVEELPVGALPDGTGFYVEDDGRGLPDGERDRVFESEFSTATSGTEFGLAIVRRVVEAHGWTVTATDGAGGGARFEVATEWPVGGQTRAPTVADD